MVSYHPERRLYEGFHVSYLALETLGLAATVSITNDSLGQPENKTIRTSLILRVQIGLVCTSINGALASGIVALLLGGRWERRLRRRARFPARRFRTVAQHGRVRLMLLGNEIGATRMPNIQTLSVLSCRQP